MKTQQEIKSNLEETERDLLQAQDWANDAYIRYTRDKINLGKADYAETQSAYSVVKTLTSKVNILRWVLGIHP